MGGTQRAEMAPSYFPLTHDDHCAVWHAVGQWAMSTPWVDAEKVAGRYTALPRGQTQHFLMTEYWQEKNNWAKVPENWLYVC